jgi:hypothetical protein
MTTIAGCVSERIAGRSPARDGVAFGLILCLVATYALSFVLAVPGDVGRDLAVCQRQAQAWLGGAPMYPAFELEGSFPIGGFGLILYPPITNALFVPTLLLPLPLWWLIPAAIVGAAVYRLRPKGRWLLVIGLCLLFPNSVDLIVAGNPDMWIAAALAIAIYWRPAAAFVFLKPSLFPLGLIGIRSRGWWAVVAVFGAVSLVLLPQTLDWLTVLRNGQGGMAGGHPSGIIYSIMDLPLLGVPLVAWAGSTRLGKATEAGTEHRHSADRGRTAMQSPPESP